MLTIMVGRKKQLIQTVDGLVFRVYPSAVNSGGDSVLMSDRTDFSDVARVQVLRRPRFSWLRPRKFRITPRMEQGIVRFLRSWHAKQVLPFDCYAFACLVYGVEDSKKEMYKYWRISQGERLQVGDVVYLSGEYAHFALYIGKGIYVSVYGGGGDMEFATLEDMCADFRTSRVFRLVRRKDDDVQDCTPPQP